MSELQQGALAIFRQAIADKLTADSLFAGIPVLTEKLQDIESQIETALGSLTCGICVIVITPQANVKKQNLPGPYFDDVSIIARVVENVIINQGDQGTKKPASYLAETVAHCLHHFVINGRAVLCNSIKLVPDPSNLIYDVSFKTNFGL